MWADREIGFINYGEFPKVLKYIFTMTYIYINYNKKSMVNSNCPFEFTIIPKFLSRALFFS